MDPKDEGDEPKHYLQVAVSFENIPPKVFMITRRTKTQLDEEAIDSLDYAEIEDDTGILHDDVVVYSFRHNRSPFLLKW